MSFYTPDLYKNKSSYFFLLLLVLLFLSSAINPPPLPHAVSVQGPQQRFLLTELLKDYNPMERPVANDSQALTVQFSFILIQVMDVVRMAEMTVHPFSLLNI